MVVLKKDDKAMLKGSRWSQPFRFETEADISKSQGWAETQLICSIQDMTSAEQLIFIVLGDNRCDEMASNLFYKTKIKIVWSKYQLQPRPSTGASRIWHQLISADVVSCFGRQQMWRDDQQPIQPKRELREANISCSKDRALEHPGYDISWSQLML